jgi:hypothetical protein
MNEPFEPVGEQEEYIATLEAENARLRATCLTRMERLGKFVAACDRLADENGRLRRACRAKKAFELAIVCLMRRIPRKDTYRVLAGKLIDRYGHHSSQARRDALKRTLHRHEPDTET